MGLRKFTNITQAELKAKGVVSLADKPNQSAAYGIGGLSPASLKLCFDKIGKLVAEKINTIQDSLSGEYAAEYIRLDLVGLNGESVSVEHSLQDLVDAFRNGSFANEILRVLPSAGSDTKTTLQAVINSQAQNLSALIESVNNLSGNKLDNSHETDPTAHTEQMALKVDKADVMESFEGDDVSSTKKLPSAHALSEVISELDTSHKAYADDKDALVKETLGYDINQVHEVLSNAVHSLSEDVDSLQLGVVPRIIRGIIDDPDPSVLDDDLKAALTAAVYSATGRSTPDNSDAVKVMDNAMPDKGQIYTYYYWAAPNHSEADGWYLAEYYTSPAITEIPSYVFNILQSSWTSTPDENGLYYITVTAAQHGMGSDNSVYVDLRKHIAGNNYASQNLFYVTMAGDIVVYSDEKFTGKIIVRVGRAYYTANDTHIESLDMDKVEGLSAALGEKATKEDVAEATTEVIGSLENLATENKTTVVEAVNEVDEKAEGLLDGTLSAKKINDLEIIKDENGVLKIGNVVIPQRKLLYQGNMPLTKEYGINLSMPHDDITIECVFSNGLFHKFKIKNEETHVFSSDIFLNESLAYLWNHIVYFKMANGELSAKGVIYFADIGEGTVSAAVGSAATLTKVYEIIE